MTASVATSPMTKPIIVYLVKLGADFEDGITALSTTSTLLPQMIV